MKKQIKKFLKEYKKNKYDKIHKKNALNALRVIEKDTGYKLSSKLKSIIDEYSIEVLGSKEYSYWLYAYTAYNQKFKEGWIPDNYFGYIVAPKVNKGIGEISNIKTMSRKIVQTDLLPDKFYMIDKTLYDQDFNVIDKKDAFHLLFKNYDELFYKKDESNQGRGVIKLDKNNFDLNELYNLGDAVIQRPIVQSEWFDEIVTGSVATIRITTLKDKKKNIKFAGSYLRVGRSDSVLVQVDRTVRIPVIDESGLLGEYGTNFEWKRHYKHPDTGYKFYNQTIPHFNKAVQTCIKLHKKIPHFAIIGWDVSINAKGNPEIIEWNARHPDIKFIETTTGPCFKTLEWEKLHNEN
ncbi:sugar-transfer associated ATP-grasp domain-containing protein [Pseudogracilibacillus sp. SO30301A]|uniref:sugar-transfer associated ATP-grasp domain-containing protein n=1 Tax=Pseudogracilibacillus sp. SO30301A TaxID=3098291 RepID=UPI00300DF0EB